MPHLIDLPSERRTASLARTLAPHLRAGDTLALHGAIGAGKSTFARALIRCRLNAVGLDEDIPSPTFTLVQTYQADDLEIWHSDLYRLTHPDEAFELGLDDAFATALCLIEWPDRLGPDLPAEALHLSFENGASDDARHLTLTATDPRWAARLAPILSDWTAHA
ncbi:tRNA (adenosine(37)-N6)-threonylcarbamoyltransferase complex ATPase subunit type 1 TsaE [Pseudoruegeria sp. SK021]|nr:tRNA (adenosine(37)-N6)-threonylcarbamoyltransferase complex ATPase subunit type 1 TsaE [Pseudoruegeria sp. SK021]